MHFSRHHAGLGRRLHLGLGCWLTLQAALSAQAQSVPNAGALQQQIERERERQPSLPRDARLPAASEQPEPAEAGSAAGALRAQVDAFELHGNHLLSSAALAPVLAPYLHRSLSYAELRQATAAVAQAYREAGWVVRTYLPPQDISQGRITIAVVESVFGSALLEGRPPQRVQLADVLAGIAAQQPSGLPLNSVALDRALLLADDLPGVSVLGTLREGQQGGSTDLMLKLNDEELLTGEVDLDNAGARSVGSERLSASLNLNSPLALGDLLSSNLVHTEGSDYLRLAYTLPLGPYGWRAGLNASQFDYRVIAPEFAALQSQGKAGSQGLEASYPLLRSRERNLFLQLNAEQRSSQNRSANSVQSDYVVENWSLGLSGNLFDNWGGGGASSASLAWLSGQLRPGAADPKPAKHPVGNFEKLRWSLSRQQVLSPDWSLYVVLSGQESADTLDASEKFYLGGASGVRAYPASEAGGSSGQLANLELRWRLPNGYSLIGFCDWGQVSNKDQGSDYSLAGSGLSLAWQAHAGLSLRATWAHRAGSNPRPSANGSDQDGSLDADRFWLSASVAF